MRFLRKYLVMSCLFQLFLSSCYHAHPIVKLPRINEVKPRTLFIALDGIDWTLMDELYREGHFRGFLPPIPLVSTFPSATTIGFTGLYQPLAVGPVPGYEVRFYSYDSNKVEGGTPLDIYKYQIKYKSYFDRFRHTMHEKGVMYAFPDVAGQQDLSRAEDVLLHTKKNVLMTYLGGTDGSAHMLGRARTKRFLIFMDGFLQQLQRRYDEQVGGPLRIVLFADHGFQYNHLKTVDVGEIKKRLKVLGLNWRNHFESQKDVVSVPYGLLSAGALYTAPENRRSVAQAIHDVAGLDLVFWHNGKANQVFVMGHDGKTARFEYHGKRSYRYVPETGDPLGYTAVLKSAGYAPGEWLSDKVWKTLTASVEYPDAGYRLYDSFFDLVQNRAGILFSLKPNYQYGALPTLIGTYIRLGHKGTHGGLFRQTSWAFAMTNFNHGKALPKTMRYDDFFKYFLPVVTNAVKRGEMDRIKKEITVVGSGEARE